MKSFDNVIISKICIRYQKIMILIQMFVWYTDKLTLAENDSRK